MHHQSYQIHEIEIDTVSNSEIPDIYNKHSQSEIERGKNRGMNERHNQFD